ncbi:hypothetical protein GCM10025867_51530 (plasmid) [Frondihabitans sucicola]|uniref:Ribbon-helix-helix protein, CopG family n=1 Tax=Frondihabitans sucicola TaxID=1268041 RepID=A0ABN6Y4V3_9MICO|nr:hypothetical protein [Frondihabitans sucicola]BDZ52345.1 hypothetical protein GCM10025867_45860 [Frondihabitans sucicola]BDZ52912.1 hypothetical protein GCM10025867_51530 [Frondihabitans sucicola]
MAKAAADGGVVRLSVNMAPETAEMLKENAARRGLSYTEEIRRAIAIVKYLDAEIASGNKILTSNAEGYRELIIV